MSDLTEEEVNKFKVSDLKKHLKKRGLACTGKKADLKKRLLEAMSEVSNTEETSFQDPESEQASEESKPDQSSEAEATEATEESEITEATDVTEETEAEPAAPVEEEEEVEVNMVDTEPPIEESSPQKRPREEGDEEENPAKRQKTEEAADVDAVVEGEAKPSVEEKEKEEPTPITGRSRTEHSLRDLLFEFEEDDIVKFVYDEIQKNSELLVELKTFMHTHPSLCKLFVRGLLPKHREMDLRTMYSRYGKIGDTRILYDRQTGISKNVGFIVFSNCEEALKALERPERTIDSPNGQKRTIYLNLAMKPNNLNENSTARSGRRMGGRGFRRYGRY